MRWSLGLILAVCLAGLQFIAVAIVVLSSYFTSERALLDHARDLLSDVANNTIEHSKGFLEPAKGAAELARRLAENQIVASDNPVLLEKLLFQQLATAPQFSGVYYGDQSGDFVFVMRNVGPWPFRSKIIRNNGEDRSVELIWRDADFNVMDRRFDPLDLFDPRARPWYKEAQLQKGSIWTDPYIFFSSKRPGITVASPVMLGSDVLQGVIGVDIEISAISEFLSRLRIGENGTALILNQNGDVIAHPKPELLTTPDEDGTLRFVSIDEIDDPVARTAFANVRSDGVISVDSEVTSEFDMDGSGYVSTLKPLLSAELPWTIAVVAPEDDFTGAIRENRRRDFWIAAAIAMATGLAGLLLAERIHRPVRAFAVRSALISQGEISANQAPPKTYRELESVNETLVKEIAQRKKTEKEYGRTFDLATRGMAQIEPVTGKFIRINAKLAEIMGYPVEELRNMSTHDLYCTQDPGAVTDGFGERDRVSERLCRRKDGTPVWISENTIRIRDDDGELLHEVVTIDDITASKHAESQIEKLNRDLSHFDRANMVGQLSAGLAHELNQPLTAITQNADAALSTLSDAPGKDTELREILSSVEEQAHRAADIIKALRGFVKKDEGKKSAFDFFELLDQTLHLVQSEATDQGVEISFHRADLPDVLGIRIQIAQVLVNLLRNAIEALASSDAKEKRVLITAQKTETGLEIAVADSGPGVDPKLDLFTQFETTKKDGMGLGLSICRAIIDANDGRLWYRREGPWKSCFYFTLPLAAQQEQTAGITNAAE